MVPEHDQAKTFSRVVEELRPQTLQVDCNSPFCEPERTQFYTLMGQSPLREFCRRSPRLSDPFTHGTAEYSRGVGRTWEECTNEIYDHGTVEIELEDAVTDSSESYSNGPTKCISDRRDVINTATFWKVSQETPEHQLTRLSDLTASPNSAQAAEILYPLPPATRGCASASMPAELHRTHPSLYSAADDPATIRRCEV